MTKNVLAALAILIAAPVAAQAQQGVELGLLDCTVAGGTGFIIGSVKDVSCTYEPTDQAKPAEQYFGEIKKFGLDIGVTGQTFMQWVVLAPTADVYEEGSLAGKYVGASADASVGVGGGANLLVGGSDRSFTLQPLSVQAQTGVNIAIGVSELDLRSAD